jgi:hypothetical protein
MATRYSDRLVETFVEFRAASDWWCGTMEHVSTERWAGEFDLRAATDLDDALSDICASSCALRFEGTLSEGAVLQGVLRLQWEAFLASTDCARVTLAAAGVPEISATNGLRMMTFALMKAARVVRDTYSDLARCLHESFLPVDLSGTTSTIESAAAVGADTFARWMETLKDGGLDAGERDSVLCERERTYAAPAYELGIQAGRIRAASIAAFRERTGTWSAVRDDSDIFGWPTA